MGSEEQARRAVGCLDGFPWSTSTILQVQHDWGLATGH
jgi:hypothetical protein